MTLLFFATDNFARVALPLARFIRRELFPRLEAVCVHRFEAAAFLAAPCSKMERKIGLGRCDQQGHFRPNRAQRPFHENESAF